MRKALIVMSAVSAVLLWCALLGAQQIPGSAERGRVTLTYLGTAGWEISDGKTVILVDPYISRILGPPRPSCRHMCENQGTRARRMGGTTWQRRTWPRLILTSREPATCW